MDEILKKYTTNFFHSYWNLNNSSIPSWSDHWKFEGEIPNQNKRGVYALFDQYSTIIYIGSGLGKSFGNYSGCGLGDRLKRYWMIDKSSIGDKKYVAQNEWKEVKSIMTIGFEEIHYPLAASLEIYLIREIQPIRNTVHSKPN